MIARADKWQKQREKPAFHNLMGNENNMLDKKNLMKASQYEATVRKSSIYIYVYRERSRRFLCKESYIVDFCYIGLV